MPGIEFADDLALIHHQNAIRHLKHLVQFQGNEQNSLTRVALRQQLLADVLDRADVKAACGLHSDQQIAAQINLAGDDRLLLVAAGHAARTRRNALTASDVKLLDQAFRIAADFLEIEESLL